jgi:hypothetical protein
MENGTDAQWYGRIRIKYTWNVRQRHVDTFSLSKNDKQWNSRNYSSSAPE